MEMLLAKLQLPQPCDGHPLFLAHSRPYKCFGAVSGTTLSGKDGLLVCQAVQIGCYSLQYVLYASNQHLKGKTNMSKGK